MGHDAPPPAPNNPFDTFPSPASITDTLSSDSLATPADTPGAAGYGLLELSGIMPSEPGNVSEPQPLTSPPLEEPTQHDLDLMNVAVGGALAPTGSTNLPVPIRSTGKGNRALRLPSFEELGIAAPHPDRQWEGVTASQATTEAVGEPQSPRLPTRCPDPGRVIMSPVAQLIATLTPPAEPQEPEWKVSHVAAAAPSDPAPAPTAPEPQSASSVAQDTSAGKSSLNVDRPQLWYDGAVMALLANIASAPKPNNALKIISHALPSPSTAGHVFPSIISRINDSAPVSPATPLTWINVFHAIPGRFNLADLPTSPPATPGPAIGGEDYFTQKVFDSAVSISDYQEDLSSLPRSPRPIVPPSTIDVSIVERYIPPSTTNEFSDMFNPNGPSILVDRLIELSPNNGSLVFVYPTRAGAHTFMKDYLGPIIDPILRTMVVVHGLSSDLSRLLGRMVAVDQLPEYETLHRRVVSLCTRLTQQSTVAQRFAGRRPHFTVSYASRQYVRLDRETWSKDWWTKQEKQRVRDVVKRFAQEAQTKRSNEHVDRAATSTELLQEVMKGVCDKPYPNGQEPSEGIEVSVFVIKRSE